MTELEQPPREVRPLGPLHLIRVDVRLSGLVEYGRRKGLPIRDIDPGYLLHSWTEGVFGKWGLRPFVIDKQMSGGMRLFGYAAQSAEALREHVDAYAEPEAHQAGMWASLTGRPMPHAWRVGQRVGFRVRLCPTERERDKPELDAFVATRLLDTPNAFRGGMTDRSACYAHWLGLRLEQRGAVKLHWAHLKEYCVRPMLRRSQDPERAVRMPRLPDVLMDGELEIRDSDGFRRILAEGVGRHRAFGFGMLRLVPPQNRG